MAPVAENWRSPRPLQQLVRQRVTEHLDTCLELYHADVENSRDTSNIHVYFQPPECGYFYAYNYILHLRKADGTARN